MIKILINWLNTAFDFKVKVVSVLHVQLSQISTKIYFPNSSSEFTFASPSLISLLARATRPTFTEFNKDLFHSSDIFDLSYFAEKKTLNRFDELF